MSAPQPPKELSAAHDWVPSTLGHGNRMCSACLMTDLEATALGEYNFCLGAKNPAFTTTRNKGEKHD